MAALLEEAGAQVRGHDDDGVLEIDLVAETVGQLAVFKHLQQDVVDVRVRLLDFVQQDDRVRVALHALGELAALFVAHVSGRRTDQLGDRVLLHVLRHVEAHQALLAAEQEAGQRARDFGLADAGGAQEQERSGRTVAGLQAGARTADGAGQRRNRLLLADDALVQLLFDAQQLGDLFFLDGGHGDAGPARHHVFDVVLGDAAGGGIVEVVLLAELAHVLALFALLVGVEARLLELVVGDGVLHAVHDELDALLDVGEIGRQGGLAQFDAGAGFVDQVDRLVRQVAVRNVAAGSEDRGLDGFVGVADGVELLVAVLDAEQDLDGVRLRWAAEP